MLRLLSVSNFATIEHLELDLTAGLNVLTGETGAGKSIIVDALGLLLGGRADGSLVRSDTRQARVEGIFQLDSELLRRLQDNLEDFDLEDGADVAGELVLSREVNREGRNVCRANGRMVPLRLYAALAEKLVDIHGQHQHLSLFRVREHLDILDRYADLGQKRAQVATLVRQFQDVRRELTQLSNREQDRVQRLDFLSYQLREIGDANLRCGEDEELATQLARADHAEKLAELVDRAYGALYQAEDSENSAMDRLGQAGHALAQAERLDASLAADRQAAQNLIFLVEDLARSLRGYRDSIDHEPERLREMADRLEVIKNLKRKYGSTVAEVLSYAERAQQELAELSGGEERREHLQRREAGLRAQAGALAGELSLARSAAAQELSEAIEDQVAELGMARTRMQIKVVQVASDDGIPVPGPGIGPDPNNPEAAPRHLEFDATGVDAVEFLLSPNPGEPLQPLARIASGGEASRLMLAIKVILSGADHIPSLVFDEVDTGVGGRLGSVLGQKLWSLGRRHQVLCVTHLPQIACYADQHLKVSKNPTGDRTITSVESLSHEARLEELGDMLGAVGRATRGSAVEMAQRAADWKQDQTAPVTAELLLPVGLTA